MHCPSASPCSGPRPAVTLRLPAPPPPQVATASSYVPSGWCGAATAQPPCFPSRAGMGRSQRWVLCWGRLEVACIHPAGGARWYVAVHTWIHRPAASAHLAALPNVPHRCCFSTAVRATATSASSLCRCGPAWGCAWAGRRRTPGVHTLRVHWSLAMRYPAPLPPSHPHPYVPPRSSSTCRAAWPISAARPLPLPASAGAQGARPVGAAARLHP